MKKWFECEECGKSFATEEETMACENKHKTEREKVERLEKERGRREKEVDEAYNKYIELDRALKKDYPMRKTINVKTSDISNFIKELAEFDKFISIK